MVHLLQPWWLLGTLPVLALAGAYGWRQRRRRANASHFANVELLRSEGPRGPPWRRHLPAIALVLAMLGLVVSMGRPIVDAALPVERATIILAIDVSTSMKATDVAPSRIEGAQTAARQFVADLPDTYNFGLVSFAGAARVLVSPGRDREAAIAAIDGLQLSDATATGDAVFTALDAIAAVPDDGADGPPPARILLLSDGYRTAGRSVEEAAAAAADAHIPVSTIAYGTDGGTVEIDGQPWRVPVDRAALSGLADTTGGRFFEAASQDELRAVYENMGSSTGHRTRPVEIWPWFAGAGLLFALAAAGLSLLWTSRLP